MLRQSADFSLCSDASHHTALLSSTHQCSTFISAPSRWRLCSLLLLLAGCLSCCCDYWLTVSGGCLAGVWVGGSLPPHLLLDPRGDSRSLSWQSCFCCQGKHQALQLLQHTQSCHASAYCNQIFLLSNLLEGLRQHLPHSLKHLAPVAYSIMYQW